MTYDATVELVAHECSCGAVYALSEEFDKAKRRDHGTFYCPNGHARHFPGESDLEKLKRQLRAEQDYASNLNGRLDAAEGSLRATKGVVTKLRKRAIAGVCAVCTRHFTDVERHMASKHPDLTA
jgi:hypothetical protein